MDKPIVDKVAVMENFPGKGGWTFVQIPEVMQNKDNPFGWVKVRGFIDDYEINHYNLQPMGNGNLFLPVKSEIRKRIKKQSGDKVRVVLFIEDRPIDIPEEVLICLHDDPELHKKFMQSADGFKKRNLDKIKGAKTEETKAKRIIKLLNELQKT